MQSRGAATGLEETCIHVACQSEDCSTAVGIEEEADRSSVSLSVISRNSSEALRPQDVGVKTASFDQRTLVLNRHSRASLEQRYRVSSRILGSGGYGRVSIAEDKEVPGRRVAMKSMQITRPKLALTFRNEVELMMRLDHPNICKILETQVEFDVMSIVMELCNGGDVFDRIIASGGRLEEDVVADVAQQVASALTYAHARGIAHCDLKPENICFASKDPNDSHVKVIDWGAGLDFHGSVDSLTVTSKVYTAPEVVERKNNSLRFREIDWVAADAWSLGVSIYVMMSGLPPFWGSNDKIAARIQAEEFPLEGTGWTNSSPDVKELIRGLLRAAPGNRLTMRDVLAHRWLKARSADVDATVSQRVLSEVQDFCRLPMFRSIFAIFVARQLEHRSLHDVDKVFRGMSAEDGTLDFAAFQRGWCRAFGEEQQVDLTSLFAHLDLDGSGKISYHEFCGAAIGLRLEAEESALTAMFTDFDSQASLREKLREVATAQREEEALEAWLSHMRRHSLPQQESDLSNKKLMDVLDKPPVANAMLGKRVLRRMCGMIARASRSLAGEVVSQQILSQVGRTASPGQHVQVVAGSTLMGCYLPNTSMLC